MIEQAENLPVIPAELGPALKMAGAVLQDEFMKRQGDAAYLSADERKKNKNPLAVVEETDLEVRLGGKRLRFVAPEEGKPIVTIPVGMSDKTSTATVPRDWVEGQLAATIVAIFEGDDTVLNSVIERMSDALDAASETDPETGRLKINQKMLPPVRYAVSVSEALGRLKRTFKTKSAGSPKVNLGFVFEDIPEPAPAPAPEPVDMTSILRERALAGFGEVEEAPVVIEPQPEPVMDEEDAAMVAFIQEQQAPEPVEAPVAPPVEPVPVEEPVAAQPAPTDSLEEQIYAAFSEAPIELEGQGEMAVCPDGVEREFFTMGLVKKTLLNTDATPKQISKAAASLVEKALMASTGERRGKRYAAIVHEAPANEVPPVVEMKQVDETEPAPSFFDPCAMCNNAEASFTDNDTPIGPRSFCSEKCWCEYTDSAYHGEGYYGFTTPVAAGINNPDGLPSAPAQPAFVEVAAEVLEESNEAVEAPREAPGQDEKKMAFVNRHVASALTGEYQGGQ